MTGWTFSPRLTKALRVVVVAIAAFYATLFVVMVIMRLLYPYEVEFMEGVIADHSLRLIQGLPIYAKPDLNFVAFLYPPLYYYASALAMKLAGISLLAPRLVSLAATLGSCAIIFVIVRQLTDRKWWAFIAVSLFIAAYGVTGYFYDIARVDALFVFFTLAGIASLALSKAPFAVVISTVCFALAFFTKQQSLLFAGASALWLLAKDRKHFAIFCVTLAALLFGGVALFDRINDGWFSYYVFGIPAAKRAEFSWYSFLVIVPDEAIKHWGLATFAVIAWIIARSRDRLLFLRSADGLITLAYLASVLAMMMSYGNLGGYRNVTMPMVAMISIVLPIALHQLELKFAPPPALGHLLLILLFAGLWVSPLWEGALFHSAQNKAAGDRFIADLASRPGPVLLPSHGFLAHLAGKPMHFHEVSYGDALMMYDAAARQLKADHDSALAQHRYGAVIIDETPLTRPDSISGYTLQGRLFKDPLVFSSKLLDIGTRPQYLFLPK